MNCVQQTQLVAPKRHIQGLSVGGVDVTESLKGQTFWECCVHNTTEVVTVNQCKSAINLFMTNWSVTSFDFVNIKLYLFTLTSPTILFFIIFDLGHDKKNI